MGFSDLEALDLSLHEEEENQELPAEGVNESLDEDGTSAGDEPEVVVSQEQALQAKVAELEDRLLRIHADFDNFRRRSRQEKDELMNYASAKLVGDLLPVLDNFALALQAAETATEADSLVKGVAMVYRQLVDNLESLGLKTMEPLGQAFDPNLHEAVMAEASVDNDPGVVVGVMRSGYYFKDKVLRPAMVKVSE